MAKGKGMLISTMTDAQTLTATAQPVDVDGNPAAPLQGVPTQALSPATAGTLTSDPTGLIATFKPSTAPGNLGSVTITFTTVAPDPIFTGSVTFTVTGSAAAGFSFTDVVT